jgi:hypothetical protein
MKAITPVNIWHEGTSKEVSQIDVAINYDDLKSYASFVYRLIQVVEVPAPDPAPEGFIPIPMNNTIASGNIYMGGADYENWDDSNDAAYEYVAGKLNLTIVPDPAP